MTNAEPKIVDPTETNSGAENYLNKAQIAHLEKAQSLTEVVYNQFKEHKAAVIGFYTIIVFS